MYTPIWNVNSKIPNGFLYNGNYFGISKLTRLHFKPVCTSFIQVRSVQRQGKNRLTSIWTMKCIIMNVINDNIPFKILTLFWKCYNLWLWLIPFKIIDCILLSIIADCSYRLVWLLSRLYFSSTFRGKAFTSLTQYLW